MESYFVIKRNGSKQKFDISKIQTALEKAAESVSYNNSQKILVITQMIWDELVGEYYSLNKIPTVEEIQDCIERRLMSEKLFSVAKSFIVYRDQHKKMRDLKKLFASDDLINQYLNLEDWRVKENSNMTYSLQGLNVYISSAITSRYWLSSVYPQKIGEAHENGDFHIHDLGILAPYCCGWDLKDLLHTGFRGVSGKVESGVPKHFRSALGQIVNFFYTLQGEAAGAQAFSSFDTYLAPYVYYDKLTYHDVLQAMQEFVFNMNMSTRVGFQTPFTNITMDLIVSGSEKDEYVYIAGEIKDKKYGEFQKEMDMINEAFAEVMMKGDANSRVFSFPIPTYNVTKNFDWDSPLLEKIMEMTAKYGIPYFANYVNSDMNPEDARSMCCRLRLDNRELRKRGGGLFGANPLTGSIGVVTINLPRLGYLATSPDDFKKRLKDLMDLAKDSLIIKRKFIEKLTEYDLFPYSKYYLRGVKERMGEYWANHFNTIGIIGMNEAILNLFGRDTDITSEKGKQFAEEILVYMRDILLEYQAENGQLFNLEATPGEGITYRLAKKDKQLYSDIITANDSAYNNAKRENASFDFMEKSEDAYFYTNSTHLPVSFTDDVFETLDHQNSLQTKYTGGTVLHVFLGERMPSVSATKKLVRTIAENYELPYFSITPTFSICPIHGYLSGEHEYCPICDSEIEKEKVKELRKNN